MDEALVDAERDFSRGGFVQQPAGAEHEPREAGASGEVLIRSIWGRKVEGGGVSRSDVVLWGVMFVSGAYIWPERCEKWHMGR